MKEPVKDAVPDPRKWERREFVTTMAAGLGSAALFALPLSALGTAPPTAAPMTIKQIIDPAQGADQFNTPDNGKHFVGVVYQVKLISGKIDDSADNCATLMGSDSHAYDSDISSIAGYSGTSNLLKLNTGESQTGAVVFQVPNGVKATTVKWTPDSCMADSTATWNVAG